MSVGCGTTKTKEENQAEVEAKKVEVDAEIDRITGDAVHRREEKAAELAKLPLEKRMQILAETPLFTAAEYDRLDELQAQLSGLNDILERFFTQSIHPTPDEDEPLY